MLAACGCPSRSSARRATRCHPVMRGTSDAQRGAEAVATGGGVHVALEYRRIGRRDAQQHETGGVALAQEARAIGEGGLLCDRTRGLNNGAGGDLLEIDAPAG